MLKDMAEILKPTPSPTELVTHPLIENLTPSNKLELAMLLLEGSEFSVLNLGQLNEDRIDVSMRLFGLEACLKCATNSIPDPDDDATANLLESLRLITRLIAEEATKLERLANLGRRG